MEHVEGFAATTLADDDPVGPHSQRVLDEVADGDRTLAFDVRGAGLEAHDVGLTELELDRVLDRHDALVARDEAREDVQHRRLARARAARDEDVEMAGNARGQQLGRFCRDRALLDEMVDLQRVAGELSNGERRAVDGERRDDRVDAGAVSEAGVDHW